MAAGSHTSRKCKLKVSNQTRKVQKTKRFGNHSYNVMLRDQMWLVPK